MKLFVNKLDSIIAERTKNLIIEEFDSIKYSVVKDLELSQVPTIKFETEDNGKIMYVRSFKTYKGMLNRKVIGQTTDYIIHINLNQVIFHIAMLNTSSFRNCSRELIRVLLKHEMRHLYQIQNKFDVGSSSYIFNIDSLVFDKGYGEDKKEMDANKYAIETAKTKKEYLVGIFNKLSQEMCGKTIVSKEDCVLYLKTLKDLLYRR